MSSYLLETGIFIPGLDLFSATYLPMKARTGLSLFCLSSSGKSFISTDAPPMIERINCIIDSQLVSINSSVFIFYLATMRLALLENICDNFHHGTSWHNQVPHTSEESL